MRHGMNKKTLSADSALRSYTCFKVVGLPTGEEYTSSPGAGQLLFGLGMEVVLWSMKNRVISVASGTGLWKYNQAYVSCKFSRDTQLTCVWGNSGGSSLVTAKFANSLRPQ